MTGEISDRLYDLVLAERMHCMVGKLIGICIWLVTKQIFIRVDPTMDGLWSTEQGVKSQTNNVQKDGMFELQVCVGSTHEVQAHTETL